MSERDKRQWAAIKADPEKYALYLQRKARERKAKPEYERERKAKWRKKNKEAADRIRRAGHAVETALQAGRIPKGANCTSCGTDKRKLEAHHHHGYDRKNWLEIVWLCPPCHRKAEKRGEV